MSDKVKDPSFNDMVTCPLNKNHKLLRGRLAKHLARCVRTNNKKNMFVVCPFNPTHRMIAADLQDHIIVCQDQIDMPQNINEEKPVSSVKQVDPGPQQAAECEEDWDLEPDVGTYDPQYHCQENMIVRTLKGQSRAERVKFREDERLRFAKMKNN